MGISNNAVIVARVFYNDQSLNINRETNQQHEKKWFEKIERARKKELHKTSEEKKELQEEKRITRKKKTREVQKTRELQKKKN